jgi:flagellar FliL protein
MTTDASAVTAAAATLEPVLPPSPAKRGKLLIIAVVGVVVLGALGGAAWFFVPRFLGGDKEEAAPAKVELPVKVTVPLGAVVVNLNGEARRYVRVGVSLGVPGPKDAKEVEESKSQVLDLLISVFASADVETLASEDGKTELKEELLARIREELHLENVARVYFTEFVIQ